MNGYFKHIVYSGTFCFGKMFFLDMEYTTSFYHLLCSWLDKLLDSLIYLEYSFQNIESISPKCFRSMFCMICRIYCIYYSLLDRNLLIFSIKMNNIFYLQCIFLHKSYYKKGRTFCIKGSLCLKVQCKSSKTIKFRQNKYTIFELFFILLNGKNRILRKPNLRMFLWDILSHRYSPQNA